MLLCLCLLLPHLFVCLFVCCFQLQREEQDRNKADAELASLKDKMSAVERQNEELQGHFKEQLGKLKEDVSGNRYVCIALFNA